MEDRGVKWTLKVSKPEDLQRMVVAGVHASVYIPEIDFEVPKIPKGLVSTTQGMLMHFREDLEINQEERKVHYPEVYEQLQVVIDKLIGMEHGFESILPFHVVINDPSGNSFISNPFAPLKDVNLKEENYVRTKEQLHEMGYVSDKEMAEDQLLKEKQEELKKTLPDYDVAKKSAKNYKFTDKDTHDMLAKMQGMSKYKDAHKLDSSKTIQEQNLDSRLTILEVNCFTCNKQGEMKTYTCEIPFFKEIVLMAFNCEHCGYRDVEVKTAGQISEKAKRITLTAVDKSDLNRDIFKSETATIKIKDLEFEMEPGSLGSFYTTVEGLLSKIYDEMQKNNPFVGDSSDAEQTNNFMSFLGKLEAMKNGVALPFVLEIDDPLDNCFILNPNYPHADPNVAIEEYDRTEEQKQELGIDLMNVEQQ